MNAAKYFSEYLNESSAPSECTELLSLCIVPVHIDVQDVLSTSVNIYCLKHYMVDIKSEINEHFVQYAGTFSELFMLVFVGIILILFNIFVQPCDLIIVWSTVAVLYCERESG